MVKGYRQILIGILLVTFHINLGPIQIVPPVFGWIVVALGAAELHGNHPCRPFRNAGHLAKVLLAYSLVTSFAEFFNPSIFSPGSVLVFAPVVHAILHLLFAYHILEGSILYARSLQLVDLERSLMSRTGTYIILYLTNALVLCYALAFHGSLVLILTAITGVILNLWFVMMMNELKKLEEAPRPGDTMEKSSDIMEPGDSTN